RVRFVLSNSGTQWALAGVGQVLRRAETDVGELAIAVAGEGPRTAHAELLYRELCLGEGGNLLGNISGRLPPMKRRCNLGILLLRLLHQLMERGCSTHVFGHGGRFHRWKLGLSGRFLSSSIADKCQCSNNHSRRNQWITSATEVASVRANDLHLSSANLNRVWTH